MAVHTKRSTVEATTTRRHHPMFTRIVVVFDGTSDTLAAVQLAQRLSEPATVLIIADVLLPADVNVASVVRGRSKLDASFVATPVAGHGKVNVEFAAPRAANVAQGLHRLARETMADLIVVSGSRRHDAGRTLLGSNATATLHGAPCAVAVATTEPPNAVRRVGVAYDGTSSGLAAVLGASTIARSLGASLTVLGVVDTRGIDPAFGIEHIYGNVRERASKRTAAAAERVRDLCAVVHQVHEGDPVHEVLRLGRDSDLLVLGSQSQGRILRLALGSVSTKVVQRASCPVLVIPVGLHLPGEMPQPIASPEA